MDNGFIALLSPEECEKACDDLTGVMKAICSILCRMTPGSNAVLQQPERS